MCYPEDALKDKVIAAGGKVSFADGDDRHVPEKTLEGLVKQGNLYLSMQNRARIQIFAPCNILSSSV